MRGDKRGDVEIDQLRAALKLKNYYWSFHWKPGTGTIAKNKQNYFEKYPKDMLLLLLARDSREISNLQYLF